MESLGLFLFLERSGNPDFAEVRDDLDLDFLSATNTAWLHPTSQTYMAGSKIHTVAMDITFA